VVYITSTIEWYKRTKMGSHSG